MDLQIEKVFSFIEQDEKNILGLVKELADIPSPTFAEKEKILFLQKLVANLGYKTFIDKCGNLYGSINGGKAAVLVVSHTDTVLTPQAKVRQDNKYFYGHGVCDNSTGIVALLTILKLIKKFNFKLPKKLLFAFTVAEEGLGAKTGMKFLMKNHKNIDAVINLESHNIGRIINQSPGQYRIKLTIETAKAGHSFRDFGNPNPIVTACQIISNFAKLPGFKKGETTFNIGTIQGGQGINSIPQNCQILLEIRSVKQEKLKFLKDNLKKILKHHKEVKITQEIIADTQAAFLPKTHKIYKLVEKVHKNLGIKSFFEMANNDAEVSLGLGIPTVTIGSSIGFNTHSQVEYVDKESIILGIKQDFLIVWEISRSFINGF